MRKIDYRVESQSGWPSLFHGQSKHRISGICPLQRGTKSLGNTVQYLYYFSFTIMLSRLPLNLYAILFLTNKHSAPESKQNGMDSPDKFIIPTRFS